MKRYCGLVLCALVAMGCEDYPEVVNPSYAPIGIQPGTRLRPKMLLADDGTIFPSATTWKDSEFGECEFRTAADGMYRCLPVGSTQNEPIYIDTGCTQPVYHHSSTACTPPTPIILVQVTPQKKCSGGEWVAFTSKETITKGLLFRINADGLCTPTFGVESPEDGSIVILDEEIPASEFVSAWR